MRVIGICGGSGSGKGAVCVAFSRFGIPSIDTDAVYRSMTERKSRCLDELSEAFGAGILLADGSLDRKKLAEVVFAHTDDARRRKQLLESISHKHILARTREIIENYRLEGVPAVLVDAPLLFESGFDKECDVTVAVIADDSVRIERIMARDSISEAAASARIAAQIPNAELASRCTYVIYNNGSIDELSERVSELAALLLG